MKVQEYENACKSLERLGVKFSNVQQELDAALAAGQGKDEKVGEVKPFELHESRSGISLSLCSWYSSYSHSHTLSITCTCCYDEIKGTQDLKIYSHAHSRILALPLWLCLSPRGGLQG